MPGSCQAGPASDSAVGAGGAGRGRMGGSLHRRTRVLVAVGEALAAIALAWLAWWCWHRGVIVTGYQGLPLHRIAVVPGGHPPRCEPQYRRLGHRAGGVRHLHQGRPASAGVSLALRRAVAFLVDANSAATFLMPASEHGSFAVLHGLSHSTSCRKAEPCMRWYASYAYPPGVTTAERWCV